MPSHTRKERKRRSLRNRNTFDETLAQTQDYDFQTQKIGGGQGSGFRQREQLAPGVSTLRGSGDNERAKRNLIKRTPTLGAGGVDQAGGLRPTTQDSLRSLRNPQITQAILGRQRSLEQLRRSAQIERRSQLSDARRNIGPVSSRGMTRAQVAAASNVPGESEILQQSLEAELGARSPDPTDVAREEAIGQERESLRGFQSDLAQTGAYRERTGVEGQLGARELDLTEQRDVDNRILGELRIAAQAQRGRGQSGSAGFKNVIDQASQAYGLTEDQNKNISQAVEQFGGAFEAAGIEPSRLAFDILQEAATNPDANSDFGSVEFMGDLLVGYLGGRSLFEGSTPTGITGAFKSLFGQGGPQLSRTVSPSERMSRVVDAGEQLYTQSKNPPEFINIDGQRIATKNIPEVEKKRMQAVYLANKKQQQEDVNQRPSLRSP